MATPKKKVSRSRRNMRRFSAGKDKKFARPPLVTCPSCSEPTRPHRVCECGHYSGREILPAKPQAALAQA